MSIVEIGNGSWLMGILLIVFGLIGLINAFVAFMLWFKKFTELLEKKAKSIYGFWLAIIVVTFGWFALFEIINMLCERS